MKDIEKVIEQVNSSMSMEGMPLTNIDIDRIQRCARDNDKVNKEISTLIQTHTIISVSTFKRASNESLERDNQYCYPFSNVLINKLGIQSADELSTAEREITSLRIANAMINIICGKYDLRHLKAIHSYIYGDIFEWAGELRCVDISKGNLFCHYAYIGDNAKRLFEQLKTEAHLLNVPARKIPYRLSYYLGEINVLHPFRDGNGRTQRLFIGYLAENAGFDVDFSLVTPKDMIEASAESFACNYTKMDTLFQRITTPN